MVDTAFQKTCRKLSLVPKRALAYGASRTKKYIHKAFINGKEIYSPFISHGQIMEGGTLELVLDELPNKEWGKNAVLPVVK